MVSTEAVEPRNGDAGSGGPDGGGDFAWPRIQRWGRAGTLPLPGTPSSYASVPPTSITIPAGQVSEIFTISTHGTIPLGTKQMVRIMAGGAPVKYATLTVETMRVKIVPRERSATCSGIGWLKKEFGQKGLTPLLTELLDRYQFVIYGIVTLI